MIFPIGDDNVKGGFQPFFSYSLIVLNVAIFLLQSSVQGSLVCEFATIPQDILQGKNYFTLISSMFLHGGWMHLLGNMLFLWIFADNIEATIGNLKFIVFYIVGGLAASFLHIFLIQSPELGQACCKVCDLVNPCDVNGIPCPGYIPSLGASGAISAVMGAYLVMYPKSRIKMIFILFFRPIYIPAYLFLLFWFGEQILSGIGTLSIGSSQSSGVAWWAHIGGFVFGILCGFLFRSNGGTKETSGKVKTEPPEFV